MKKIIFADLYLKHRLRTVSRLLFKSEKSGAIDEGRERRSRDQRESSEAAIVTHNRGFTALPLIAASPFSALVNRTAFFGFNSKRETARSLSETSPQERTVRPGPPPTFHRTRLLRVGSPGIQLFKKLSISPPPPLPMMVSFCTC